MVAPNPLNFSSGQWFVQFVAAAEIVHEIQAFQPVARNAASLKDEPV